jgi:hypothetical protein
MDNQKFANIIARKNGYGKATEVVITDKIPVGMGKVITRIEPGYRKKTTGEYVPNAYRNNFGWKNTYYQFAITVVAINPDL